jgi:hypothetical protein
LKKRKKKDRKKPKKRKRKQKKRKRKKRMKRNPIDSMLLLSVSQKEIRRVEPLVSLVSLNQDCLRERGPKEPWKL